MKKFKATELAIGIFFLRLQVSLFFPLYRPRRVELESGVFTSLLRSFLPNYDPSAPPPGGPPAANNLEALMEGIRELLAGLQPAPPPVQNRQREQGEEEEEEVVEEVD